MGAPNNAPSSVLRGFVAVQITLAATQTNYNLLSLINTALAAETGTATGSVCPGMVRQITIQSHPGIDGSGANTASILIGDGKLSATRFGTVLGVGYSMSDRSPMNNVNLSDWYARFEAATTNQKLNISVYCG